MTRCLLDTHALAWWLMDSPKLASAARRSIENRNNTIFVSSISAYEASYKHHRGLWPEAVSLVSAFDEIVAAEGFEVLPLAARHAVRAGEYSRSHRDPFDRMLAAQAIIEGMPIVSGDAAFRALGADVIW